MPHAYPTVTPMRSQPAAPHAAPRRFALAQLPLALFVLLVLLAGCGSTGADTSASQTTPTAPPAVATATTASSGTPVTGTAVKIQNFKFTPDTLSIKVGATVTWTDSTSTTSHTVTSDTGLFDSGTLSPGGTFSHTFTQPGTFAYHCNIHPSMMAQIVVTA